MLEDYLQELQKITLLQPEEEAALWQAYKEGGDAGARSRLIEQYQPLVFKEAMRWNIHTDLCSMPCKKGHWGSWKPLSAMTTAAVWPFPYLLFIASTGLSSTI